MRIIALILMLAAPALAGPTVAFVTDSDGFVHDVVKPQDGESLVVRTMRAVVEDRLGGTLVHVADAADLSLDGVDVVAMYTTGPIPLDVGALRSFVEGGGGLLGVHCAADTLKDDAAFGSLLGGVFDGHPWNAGDAVTLANLAPRHPAARSVGGSRALKEEIYQFRDFDPAASQVLIALDLGRTQKKAGGEPVPVAWLRDAGEGRVAYTSLGHRQDVWEGEWYQQHLAALIEWADGEGGDAEPNPADFLAERPQTDGEPSARGWDPWVLRCVLDRRPRVVVVALSDDLWAAWDAESCALYKVWPGGMNFTGSVYDTRHGPQPQTVGDPLDTFGDAEQWQVLGPDGGSLDVRPIWRGYRVDGTDAVTFTTEFRLPTGDVVTVRETPEVAGPRSLRRTFDVSGLPDGHALRTYLANGDADVQVDGAGEAEVEQRGQPVRLIRMTADGTATATTTW